jgi:hypothetical protein
MLAVDLYCLGMRQAIVRPSTNEMPVTRASNFRCFQSNDRRVAQCSEAGALRLMTSGEEIVVLISSPNAVDKRAEV